MTTTLKILLILGSILTFVFIIRKIRKSQMNIADAIIWIIGAMFLMFISIFSELMDFLALKLGFLSTVNFVFVFFIFFLIIMMFSQTVKISILNEKIKNLNHYIALQEEKKKDKQ